MTPIAFGFLAFTVIFAFTFWVARRLRRDRFFLHAELWVPLPGEEAPEQARVMNRLLQCQDYVRNGRSPITPAEGLVMSDVRLDIELVKRAKNRLLFEQLGGSFDDAAAFVRIRFVSETPVPDLRHLQFMAYAAEAYLHLGDGFAVYNQQTEQTWSRLEFIEKLKHDPNGARFELWGQIDWLAEEHSGTAKVNGLRAIGLQELRTPISPLDHRHLVCELMRDLCGHIWQSLKLPTSFQTEAYGDQFEFKMQPKKDYVEVRIMRVQAS